MPTNHKRASAPRTVLASGLGILGLVVLSMIVRGVDSVEVLATAAFAPIFLAALAFGLRGGLLAAVGATTGYLLLRWPAIRLVGWAPLSGLLTTRIIGFLAFGGIGGWAAEVVRGSLTRLALFDGLDDATGLGNARSFLSAIEREQSRSARYAGVFSVVHATFEPPAASPRSQRNALKHLGTRLVPAVRTSDHLTHMITDQHHLLLVLPETGAEGAGVVAENLKSVLVDWGVTIPAVGWLTIPGGEPELERLESLSRSTIEPDPRL